MLQVFDNLNTLNTNDHKVICETHPPRPDEETMTKFKRKMQTLIRIGMNENFIEKINGGRKNYYLKLKST